MIKIYKDADALQELLGNQILTTHNGFTGESSVFKVYLKNDDANKTYNNVNVRLEIHESLQGWQSKVLKGSEEPSEEEWDSASDSVQFDINDTTTIYEISFRLACPAGETSEYYQDKVSIKVTATEINNQ